MNNQLRSYIQDKQLVECVAKYPSIYNPQNKDYKSLHIREAIWKEISEIVGRNKEDCKKRYQYIKDTYLIIKTPRKMIPRLKMSRVSLKSTEWNLAPLLKLLDVLSEKNLTLHIDDMDYYENFNSEQNEDEEATDTQVTQPLPLQQKNKIKEARINTKQLEKKVKERSEMSTKPESYNSEEYDDVDFFLKSLGITIKKLPPQLIVQAKVKMSSIIMDLELQASSDV